jgi:hypothetical protein
VLGSVNQPTDTQNANEIQIQESNENIKEKIEALQNAKA